VIHVVNKGKDGEREVRLKFRELLKGMMNTELIQRNHQQAEVGGADLVGVPFLAVEIKRVKKINWAGGLDDWWQQAWTQADNIGKEPCLVFRENFGKWFVMIFAKPLITGEEAEGYPMIMRWDNFAAYYSEQVRQHASHADLVGEYSD